MWRRRKEKRRPEIRRRAARQKPEAPATRTLRMLRVLAVGAALGCASGAEIVVAGDSWGEMGKKAFERMFASRGFTNVTILNVAVSGSSAAEWARSPNNLVKHLGDDTRHVWLSISGNDAQYDLPGCGLPCVPELVEVTKRNILRFVQPALDKYPKVQVVQFGYDILNFDETYLCEGMGDLIVPQCIGNITCFNSHFQGAIQKSIIEGVAAVNPRHHAVNIAGALQQAGGVPGASIGHPVLSRFTPPQLMQPNCIHPSFDRGFDVVMNALWKVYFAAQYGPPSRPPPPRARGAGIGARNTTASSR